MGPSPTQGGKGLLGPSPTVSLRERGAATGVGGGEIEGHDEEGERQRSRCSDCRHADDALAAADGWDSGSCCVFLCMTSHIHPTLVHATLSDRRSWLCLQGAPGGGKGLMGAGGKGLLSRPAGSS
jgi:hypothetical protein